MAAHQAPPSLGFSRQGHWSVSCYFLLQCMKVKSESEVTQLCTTLSNSMDCSLPSSSVHGIFQARVLEWGAIAFSDQPILSPFKIWFSLLFLWVIYLLNTSSARAVRSCLPKLSGAHSALRSCSHYQGTGCPCSESIDLSVPPPHPSSCQPIGISLFLQANFLSLRFLPNAL